MQVQYEPALLDAVLSALIQEREASGDLRFTHEYHALTDPAYGLAPSAREEAFRHIHRRLFRRWKLTAPVEAILAEFPEIQEQVTTLWVVGAPTPRDEGADLQVSGQTTASLRLLPRRLLDPRGLQRLLRHELTHLADLLDPTFAYDAVAQIPGILPAEEPLIQDRYRLLWDITVDGRLLRAERETVASREQRRTEFEAQYRGVPGPLLERTLRRLAEMPRPAHPDLLEMATDPGRALFGTREGTNHVPPGSLCPLCRFPSAQILHGPGQIAMPLAETIRGDFPEWRPELGACERCLERYTVCRETP
ncbi:MAG: hypothetical protein ACE5IQ_12010 [Candidatus Methylomirabilales bacterium]